MLFHISMILKVKKISGVFGLILLVMIGCEKENTSEFEINYPEQAKLKRTLIYPSPEAKDPLHIVDEYEYDQDNRLIKVSSPWYEDTVIVGTIKYDLYDYDTDGRLSKISKMNANIYEPGGFLNLENNIYTYNTNGFLEKEFIEYPQINTFEYNVCKYSNEKLLKREYYDVKDQLLYYIEYEYNDLGELVKESSYTSENDIFLVSVHSYRDGLNYQTNIYTGIMETRSREIIREFDSNRNLVLLESNELLPYSSMRSYKMKYEYFEQ